MPCYLIGKINIVNMAIYKFKANYRFNLYQNINGIFLQIKKIKCVYGNRKGTDTQKNLEKQELSWRNQDP